MPGHGEEEVHGLPDGYFMGHKTTALNAKFYATYYSTPHDN